MSNTIKNIAPYLDPHLLLFFLQRNSGKDTGATAALQKQIKSKLLMEQKEKSTQLVKSSAESAKKLLDVLNNQQEKQ